MDSLKPTLEELTFCIKEAECIRNVCILAHVDHGKTTVADSLLATNRLVSKRMAGFLRYLDDRPDEQERGITMKSSAVSLLNLIKDDDTSENTKILLNLIDTPGHIDFSSEVGAALKVCDGAIILVDLVEGVCVQTRESIKQAFEEHSKMILVLNKFDRLVVELEKELEDIFQSILRVIEGCNAIIAELYQYEFHDAEVDIEDTGLLFSPDTGNVIFASAIDGWGFTTKQISKMIIEMGMIKGETVESLNQKMWNFDCYIDSKKEIKTGAVDKKKTNLFAQFCLKTIVHIYQTIVVRMEKDKTEVILDRLGIKQKTRDMTHNDPKVQVRAILQAWKPLATTILHQCLKIIPSPSKLDRKKIEYLLNVDQLCEDLYLNKCIDHIVPYFENLSVDDSAPIIAYVSKMFCVNKRNLSQNKPKTFVPKPRSVTDQLNQLKITESIEEKEKPTDQSGEEIKTTNEDFAVIALTRVFAGTLRPGQELFVLLPSYVPKETEVENGSEEVLSRNTNIIKVTINELYMLFGRELMLVDSIPAGNVCGIGGIETEVVRSATLSSTLEMVPFKERLHVDPVVRHSIEPVNPRELPILREALKLLMQSDSCVQVIMQETGELVLLTAGDVHLGKCIEDLRHLANIEVQVSSPMVSLRETIINELSENNKTIECSTKHLVFAVSAVSLPKAIVEVIRNNYEVLKNLELLQKKTFIDSIDTDAKVSTTAKVFKREQTQKVVLHVQEQLKAAFESAGSLWKGFYNKIWSVGKIKECTNLLLNSTTDYNQSIFVEVRGDNRTLFDYCIVNAFNSLCRAGPLCEEPLANCAFVVKKLELTEQVLPEDVTPQLMANVEITIRNTMKKAFENEDKRLMEPMYTTDIQVNTSILGKVYTVVNKRHGKVLDAVGMDEQEKTFLVKAEIPVIESIGFASEIRKTTSGQANPSLCFSHYEVIDGDPLYEPVENEEDSDDEDEINLESALRAVKLRRDVRRRKGLHVGDEVVVHAEKQRTLNKKK